LTFNFEKELSFTLTYSNNKFSVKAGSSGKATSPKLTGSIAGNLKLVANLIPSINVMVMGSPIRVRT